MVADRGLNRDTDSITYLVVVAFPFFFGRFGLGCLDVRGMRTIPLCRSAAKGTCKRKIGRRLYWEI